MTRRASYLLLTDFERLEEWCRQVRVVLGEAITPYLVGSANETPDYRDIDVRVILPDKVYDRYFSDPVRVRFTNHAISTWGQRETGLPIDFQIQRMTEANKEFKGFRNPMGLRDWSTTHPGTGRP